MFIATLFIIAKIWKQLRFPSVSECANKLWYIQTMEHYSALKVSELLNHEKIWKKHKGILLSERSQSEKATDYMIPTIWHSGKGKNYEDSKKINSGQGLERGNEEPNTGF